MDEAPPRVVIVGAGFGGLYAARALARAPVRVTIVDRRNYHLFQPLLYQVATAALPRDRPLASARRSRRSGSARPPDIPRGSFEERDEAARRARRRSQDELTSRRDSRGTRRTARERPGQRQPWQGVDRDENGAL